MITKTKNNSPILPSVFFGFWALLLHCGVETGNPKKGGGDTPKSIEQEEVVEAFLTQYSHINASSFDQTQTESEDSSSTTSLFLADPAKGFQPQFAFTSTCEIDSSKDKGTFTYDRDKSFAFDYGKSPNTKTLTTNLKETATSQFSGLEGKAICLAKILIIPYAQLSAGEGNVIKTKERSIEAIEKNSAKKIYVLSTKSTSEDRYQWKKLNASVTEGYQDQLTWTINTKLTTQVQNFEKNINTNLEAQISTRDDQPLVQMRKYLIKENAQGKPAIIAGSWQETTITSGTIHLELKSGRRLTVIYNQLKFAKDTGCHAQSGKIGLTYHSSSDDSVGSNVEVTITEQNLVFKFLDGSTIERELDECKGY